MKLPFVRRAKYEKAQKNLENMNNARLQLEHRLGSLSKEYDRLLQTNREAGMDLEYLASQVQDLKKEVKRLKTKLTRNGIMYNK